MRVMDLEPASGLPKPSEGTARKERYWSQKAGKDISAIREPTVGAGAVAGVG